MEVKTHVRESGLVSVVNPPDDRQCYHLIEFLRHFGRIGFVQDFHYLQWKQMEGDQELVNVFEKTWKGARKPFES